MLKTTVISKSEDLLSEFQASLFLSVKDVEGFGETGGVFVSPLLKSDGNGNFGVQMVVGRECTDDFEIEVNLEDIITGVDKDFGEEDAEDAEELIPVLSGEELE